MCCVTAGFNSQLTAGKDPQCSMVNKYDRIDGQGIKGMRCIKIDIPKECCYIGFSHGTVDHSADFGFTTRGEQMILDFDKKGDIMGIELLSSKKAKKPCMDSASP